MALVEVSQLAMLLMISAQLETTLAAYNFTLPPSHCSKSCGNISIHYPFGIGDGCFRAGFNLTCTSYNHTSPRLFLGDGTVEVSEINMDKGVVYIKSPIVTMSANSTSVSAQLIDLRRWPFSFNLGALYGSYFQSLVGNSWYAVGCSAIAVLVDSNTNKTVDNCLTVCSTTQPFATDSCVLDPYGKIWDKLSLGIELTRLSQLELHLVNTSDVKVIMYDRSINADDAEEPQQDSTMKRKITGSEVNAALAWYINDYESCNEAKNKTTYACLSENSECLDAVADSDTMNTIGYMCRCSLSYSGNPYLPHGCQDSSSLTVNPASDCTTAKCGSIDIPYPFGLSEGCYRDQSFSLECDDATDPPALVYRNFYVVTNILLGEGKLELKITDHFPFYLVTSDIKTVAFIEQRTIYSWVVAYQPCKDAKKNTSTFACVDQHSLCVDDNISSNGREILGYRCECSEGYEGNPYLHNGCKDINECKSKDKYKCYGICTNTKGNYNCICPPGSYSPDPKIQNCTTDGHDKKQSLLLANVYNS
ncbi:wall-associated receptor kinase 3-like [Canna indica]|uniref:Wall-associated receptor kinase 3-like n=1 Tax=Canna indica TaxID=4628 RepID=A0AAQ3JZA8_9LILI|nr:wall-associated receptor kinase 3-like [Canna indica]